MAEAVVSYRFVATGADAVKSAFKSIDAAAKKAMSNTQASFTKAGKAAEVYSAKASVTAQKSFMKMNDKIQADNQRQLKQWESYFNRVGAMAKRSSQTVGQAMGGASRAPKAGKGVGGLAGGVALGMGSIWGTAAALGGGALLATSARRQISAEESSARISALTAVGGKGAVDKNIIQQAVQGAALGVQGTKVEDAFSTLESLMDRFGDFDSAMKLLTPTLQAAAITGQDSGSIVELLSGMKQSGNVAVGDLPTALATALQQGKSGSIPLGRFADKYTKLLASAGLGGYVRRKGGVEELGSIFQNMGGIAGSADEVITSISRAIDKLAEAAPKLGGMALTDEKGNARDLATLFSEAALRVYQQSGGNVAKSQVLAGDLFGEEGKRVIGKVLTDMINATGKAAPSIDEVARKADEVRQSLLSLKNETATAAQLQAEAARVTDTAGAKMRTMFENTVTIIGNAMNPALDGAADKLKQAAPLIEGFGHLLGMITSVVLEALAKAGSLGEWIAEKYNRWSAERDAEKRAQAEEDAAVAGGMKRGAYRRMKREEERLGEAGLLQSVDYSPVVLFTEDQMQSFATIVGDKVANKTSTAIKNSSSTTVAPDMSPNP